MDDEIITSAGMDGFADEEVTNEEIEIMLMAATLVDPTDKERPWEFVVTRDPDVKRKLSEISSYANPIDKADAVIVPCLKKTGLHFPEYAPFRMNTCIGNIVVEAVKLGIGIMQVGVYPLPKRMEAVADIIGTPDDVDPFALIAIGYPPDKFLPLLTFGYDYDRIRWI